MCESLEYIICVCQAQKNTLTENPNERQVVFFVSSKKVLDKRIGKCNNKINLRLTFRVEDGMSNEESLSLANLKNGAAIEAFDLVLQDVLMNIQDPNTEAKDVREITLRVKFRPDEDRFMSGTEIECWPNKLAKRSAITTQIAMDVDRDGVIAAKEVLPMQQNMFDKGAEPKVHPIRKES